MTVEELEQELARTEDEWERTQNRVNELLAYLKVAQDHTKRLSEKIGKLRGEIYRLKAKGAA